MGVKNPRDILTHRDNPIDIAEKYDGTNEILRKISIADKPRDLSGIITNSLNNFFYVEDVFIITYNCLNHIKFT